MEAALVTAIATDGGAARAALTSSELRLCSRLVGPRRRRDFRAGRLAGKRAAAAVLGCRAGRRIEVRTSADGSPRLARVDARGRSRAADASISISHRDGRAVAAAAPGTLRVGIDLERLGSVATPTAGYFLTPDELARARLGDFTILWSLKEAAWKALALGRSVPFKDLELCMDPQGGLRALRIRGATISARAALTSPWPGYVTATVWTTEA